MTLTRCSDLSAADWITARDRPWQQLVEFGPSGFPAYARLRFLPDPAYDGHSENDVDVGDNGPSEAAQLRMVMEVLARHTGRPTTAISACGMAGVRRSATTTAV